MLSENLSGSIWRLKEQHDKGIVSRNMIMLHRDS